MDQDRIAIVGGGNIGGAIAEGLVESGHCQPEHLKVTRRRVERLQHLAARGIDVGDDNRGAVRGADIVLLAVDPVHARPVLEELAPVLEAGRHVLVSCVTGFSLAELAAAVGAQLPILRAMPNTAVTIRQAVTCVCTENADETALGRVEGLFAALGRVVFIREELMAAATVLGACGVAFALRFLRAASQGGIEIGFDAETAQLVTAQTVLGAASLLLARDEHPEREIDRVTTPQGCTIAGLNEMEHQGFSSALIKGITTSFAKVGRLADIG